MTKYDYTQIKAAAVQVFFDQQLKLLDKDTLVRLMRQYNHLLNTLISPFSYDEIVNGTAKDFSIGALNNILDLLATPVISSIEEWENWIAELIDTFIDSTNLLEIEQIDEKGAVTKYWVINK